MYYYCYQSYNAYVNVSKGQGPWHLVKNSTVKRDLV